MPGSHNPALAMGLTSKPLESHREVVYSQVFQSSQRGADTLKWGKQKKALSCPSCLTVPRAKHGLGQLSNSLLHNTL